METLAMLCWTVEVSGAVSQRRLWSSTSAEQGSDLHWEAVTWTGMVHIVFLLFQFRNLSHHTHNAWFAIQASLRGQTLQELDTVGTSKAEERHAPAGLEGLSTTERGGKGVRCRGWIFFLHAQRCK